MHHLPKIRAFLRNKRGNVAIIAALTMLPISMAVGMGVDYTLATRKQDQINGLADGAALSAVTPTAMDEPADTAAASAKAMFLAQIATVPNVTYSPSSVTATATDTTVGAEVTRNVTVSYTAGSPNVFSTLLGMDAFNIAGTSSAKSALAPRTDFYMLLDTSPSMAIAATSAGIATMVANTASQSGCAFGCHETNPSADHLGNPGGEDNFALARNLGVPLRIDLVNQATQNLMSVAQVTATQNNTVYRAAIYTMDYNFNTLQPLTGSLSTAATAAANIQQVEVYDNNCLTSGNCNHDEDSYLDGGLNNVNSIMPNPGNGSANPGDTPQEVVFIVSDGVDDELLGGSRVMAPINTRASWCDTIKARGIRIAFLYLTYNPLPTNAFYNANIAPFQSQIATDAQNCASTGLFFQVNTDDDVSAAMNTLFQKVVSTAHLTH
ncbi:MAG: TadE/TadG family type IV pilus assembly protein [Caulobacterales bacterium]